MSTHLIDAGSDADAICPRDRRGADPLGGGAGPRASHRAADRRERRPRHQAIADSRKMIAATCHKEKVRAQVRRRRGPAVRRGAPRPRRRDPGDDEVGGRPGRGSCGHLAAVHRCAGARMPAAIFAELFTGMVYSRRAWRLRRMATPMRWARCSTLAWIQAKAVAIRTNRCRQCCPADRPRLRRSETRRDRTEIALGSR